METEQTTILYILYKLDQIHVETMGMTGESRKVICPSNSEPCFAGILNLPFDVIGKIAGSFEWPDLWAATKVCVEWSEALGYLRHAMHFVHLGKKLEHGQGGESRNLEKTLELYLRGAVRGCAVAMVEAGLVLFKMGRRTESIQWLKQAAELGNIAGQYHLGSVYLLAEPSCPIEAYEWFHRAALAGHVCAQYTYAIFLLGAFATGRLPHLAVHWFLRAAEGDCIPAGDRSIPDQVGDHSATMDNPAMRRLMARRPDYRDCPYIKESARLMCRAVYLTTVNSPMENKLRTMLLPTMNNGVWSEDRYGGVSIMSYDPKWWF